MRFGDDLQLLILAIVCLLLLIIYGWMRWFSRLVWRMTGTKDDREITVEPPRLAVLSRGPTPGLIIWESLYGNKLLGAELVLVMLIVYGQAFRSYGIPELFWPTAIPGQWTAGLATALFLCLIFYAAWVVDEDVRARWAVATANEPGNDPVRALWSYMATCSTPFLILAALPGVLPAFRPRIDHCGREFLAWPWLAGLVTGVLLVDFTGRFRVFSRGLWLTRRLLGRATPSWPEFRDSQLGEAGENNAGNLLATFVVIYLLTIALGVEVFSNAALLICFLLGLVASIYAFLGSKRRRFQLISLGLVVYALWANSYAYKLVFPGLDYPPPASRLVTLGDVPPRPIGRPRSKAVLDNWLKTVESLPRSPGVPAGKPKLAILCVSGGAIRAATWTAAVLTRLEKEIPHFPRHLRLITGASGGMLGAAYYTTSLHKADHDRIDYLAYHERIVDDLSGKVVGDRFEPHDFLTPVVAQMVLRDLPLIFWPGVVTRDRGVALEEAWTRWTDGSLSTPMAELRADEEAGRIPSLIISPMFVEDGRRLLISNLDLAPYTENRGSLIDEAGVQAPAGTVASDHGDNPLHVIYSRPAVEFSRLFPEASRFAVGTAVRMNASFPYVSPAVCLPTSPSRRVVDAGYYDNYGVDLAAAWVFANSGWLAENTSGVVLIQVRAFRNEDALKNLGNDVARRQPPPREARDAGNAPARPAAPAPAGTSGGTSIRESIVAKLEEGAQFFTSPINGFSSARTAVNFYRNDEQIEVLSRWFREHGHSPEFFTTVIFTCDEVWTPAKPGQGPDQRARDAARSNEEETLSWTIGLPEKLHIAGGTDPCTGKDVLGGMDRSNNNGRLRKLIRWWSDEHDKE